MVDSQKKQSVLVTGGAGFIGSQLVPALLKAGHTVAVVDNLSFGKREAVPAEARFFECDVRSAKLAHIFALEKPQVVVHLAAQTNVRYSVTHPQDDADINILGTLNVITQSRRYGIKKFVFASSGGEVYGQANVLPTPENHPTRPKCPYGITKLFGEQCLAHYGDEEGLDWVALRLANVYGPGQDGSRDIGIIAIALRKLNNGESIAKIGDWEQTRDFIYIDDTVEAFMKAMATDTQGWPAQDRLINIGTGQETSMAQLIEKLEAMTGRKLKISKVLAEVGAPQRKSLNAALAAKLLGWTPGTSLSEGLAACAHELSAVSY